MIRSTAVVAAVVVLVAACSGGDDTDGSPSNTTVPEVDDAPADTETGATVTTAPVTDEPDVVASATTVPATTVPPPTAPPPTAPPTTAPTPLVEGLEATIELLTPEAGAGIRPLLEWTPADGASMYSLAVSAPDGAPYWTWTGPETSVHVGGNPRLADSEPGPSVSEGMSWAVIAFDVDMVPIAVSNRRSIAP